MKKIVIQSTSIEALEKKKYEKLLEGWKVKKAIKKFLFWWFITLEKENHETIEN